MTLEDKIITITTAKKCHRCGAPVFIDFYDGEYQTQCRTCGHEYFKDEYEELDDYGSVEVVEINPRRIILEKHPELSQYDYVYCWGDVKKKGYYKVDRELFAEIKNAISPLQRWVDADLVDKKGINNLYIGKAFRVATQGLRGLTQDYKGESALSANMNK